MDKSLYYDINPLLSFNRLINFVIGARGIGKTYGAKKFAINRFIKYGEQFIYLRRYKPELKKIKAFFDSVAVEFPNHTFKVKGREFYIDGKLAGFALPLSSWQSEKSSEYPNVNNIIYDEFIRQKDNSGYMPDEVNAFLNLIHTIIRNRDNARCICLSNAVSIVNPYFLYFNLIPDVKKRFNTFKQNGEILIEIPNSDDFKAESKKTRFGKLIDGTDYADMAVDNDFIGDKKVFIEKRSKESKFVFSIVYKGMTMGIWVDQDEGLMFLANEHDPSSKLKFALTTDDLNENTMLMTSWKQNYYLKKMVSAFVNGFLRFDNQVLRNVSYEMFKRMNVQ